VPNGESKNWIRFLITLESYHVLYGHWPTEIHLYPFFIDELRGKLSAEDFRKLQSKIKLEADQDNPFLSLDDQGKRFDYVREKGPRKHPKLKAIDWLGIREPDYED